MPDASPSLAPPEETEAMRAAAAKEAQRHRVRVTERRIALARLMLVISGFVLYPALDGRPGTHTFLAWSLLIGSVPYAVLAVIYQPVPKRRPVLLSYATSVMDAGFVMLWLWATGGYQSPFYLAIYIGMVSNAVRYTTGGTLFSAVVYGIGYTALFLVSGLDVLDAYPEFAVRIAYMGMAAVTGLVVTRVIQDEVAARLDLESRMRTERMEARLARAERMASLGTLAGGVAHEINNPLSYVMANLQFLREELQEMDRPDLVELLSDAEEGSVRIRRIVSDLKSFSRERPPSLESTDLDKVLRSAINMSRHQLKHRARLVDDFGSLPPVKGDETRLAQVVLNLVINAAQSIPEGNADKNEVRVTGRHDGEHVILEISDTGDGIAPEILPRIFDPFFTTKAPGEGTGLGLPICHRIVRDLGGSIEVESEPDHGTTMRVKLRAADRAPQKERTEAPELAPRRLRVLVIDDEPALSRSLTRALREHHEVDVDTSADDALRRLASGPDYDVILCDLTMPVTTGADFFHALEDRHPDLTERCVFMTGGAFTAQASRFLSSVDNRCLEKPFSAEDALRLIDEMTSAESSPPG